MTVAKKKEARKRKDPPISMGKQELLKLNVLPDITSTADHKAFAAKSLLAYYKDLVACRRNVLAGSVPIRQLYIEEFTFDRDRSYSGARIAEVSAHAERLRAMTSQCDTCSACPMRIARTNRLYNYQHCKIRALERAFAYNEHPKAYHKVLSLAVKAANKALKVEGHA